MRFLAPAPYAAAEHEKAAASRNFAPLSKTTERPGGCVSVVEIPRVDPWGILVVEPGDGRPETPWQPAVWCDETTRLGDTVEVRLDCLTRGAEIRYTLDGSEPTKSAKLYSQPLRLNASATVKAKAFGPDGTAGPGVSARFERGEAHPRLAPDAPVLRDALKLWLKADTLAATLKDGAAVQTWPAAVGPDAVVSSNTLLSGAAAGAPSFGATVLNGHPGVRFDGVDDQMVVRGFANACLAGKPFTVVLVTQSQDSNFGICGNAANGSGGIPRLYLTRGMFSYDRLEDSVPVVAGPGSPAVTVYQHNGQKTASARVNGRPSGERDDLPLVKEFGGGSLAIPFWSGSANHSGEIGEIIAYDRQLTAAEIEAVEEDLAVRYS
ncbi:MAG: hypothetical protein FJ272_12325, partial [Planctomycetes bacterium]|nr:hypothetical protein [Planctomycetota bacterium]